MSGDSTKDDEESLFLAEMAGVTPLKTNNKVKTRKKPAKPLQQTHIEDENFIIDDVFSCAEMVDDCPDVLSFSRSGLQHNTFKKLRLGKNPIEHSVDLHGLTVEQARDELIEFFKECEIADIRHAIIVHGKGFRSKDKAVIKPMINRWLRAADNVLAFHSAQPADGGTGAVYLLLKKAKH